MMAKVTGLPPRRESIITGSRPRVRRTSREFRPEAPMVFEDRALMSITLPFTGGTSYLPSGPSLYSSVGLSATAPVASGNLVNFSFSNSGNQPITVGIATYYDAQDPPNVNLGMQTLKGVEYLTVAAHGSATASVPLQPCTQYDAFINYVGTTFESGPVIQYSSVFLNPSNSGNYAGPPTDGGYNTQGFQPTTPTTPVPAGLLGTLVAFAQSTDTNNASGVCPPPPPLDCGATTTTCFWVGCQGQSLINSLGKTSTGETVGQWLVQTFPNLFGAYANSSLTSSSRATSDAAVASLYNSLYMQSWGSSTLVETLDLALAAYATDESLNSSASSRALAQSDGFTVSNLIAGVEGTGGKTYSVSTSTARALGLTLPNGSNGNNFSVIQILLALDHYAQSHSSINSFDSLLDGINTACDCGSGHSGHGGDGGDDDGGDENDHNGGGGGGCGH